MSALRFRTRLLVPLSLLLAFPPGTAPGEILHWDADGNFPPPPEDPLFGKIVDGYGAWQEDPANLNWTADGGLTNVAWTNPAGADPPNDAVFGNNGESGAAVTVTAPIRVGNITWAPMAFPESFYTITGPLELRRTLPLSDLTMNHDGVLESVLSGSGFAKKGSGKLLLRSNLNSGITYTPSLDVAYDIREGTLELGPAGVTNSRSLMKEGTIRIAAGATLRLLSPQRIQDDRTIVRIENGGTFDLNAMSGSMGSLNGVAVTGAEKFGYLEGDGSFRPGPENFMLHFGGGAEFHSFAGIIGGTGHVWVDAGNIKSYSVQEFTGDNTFTGNLGVYTGTLAFSKIASLGASTDPVINLGTGIPGDNPVHGILRYTGNEPLTFVQPLNLYASGTAGVQLGGGGFEASGTAPEATVTLASTITSANGDKTFVLGGTHTGDNVMNSTLVDAGIDPDRFRIRLLKTGGGTWRLAAAGGFTGGMEMNAGTLHLDTPAALNADPGNQNSLRLHGGTLMLNGNSLVLGNGTPEGWGLSGAGGVIANTAAPAVTLVVDHNSSAAQVFRGAIDDTGGGAVSLVKRGTGALTFSSAAHRYSGSTTIEGGTLRTEAPASSLPVNGAVWHLDASDPSTITQTGGLVSGWADKSPGRRHLALPAGTVAVTVTQPSYVSGVQNGLNAVRFNGTSDVLSSALPATAATVFIVCSNAENGNGTLKGGGIMGGNGLGGVPAQSGIRGPRGGLWYGPGENVDFCRPNGSEFRVNGALTSTVTPDGGNYWHTVTAVRSGSTVNYNSIGGFPSLAQNGDNYWFKGDIGEVVVYATVLSPEQRGKVEAYLRRKWFGGAAAVNYLPPATSVSVAAGATFDSGVPQTVAGLTLAGALKTGAPAGELAVAGPADIAGGAILHWEVADWNGPPGIGYDVLSAETLTFSTAPETPVTVKIGQPVTVANASRTARDFTLIRSSGAVTGFDASHFTLDAAAFTAVPGTWSVVKNGNNIVLHFEPVGAGPYELWIESFGLSGASATPGADPDSDGWANVLEFGVHGNPVNGGITAPVTERVASAGGDPAFSITLPVRSGAVFTGADALSATVEGLRYTVQGSDDLSAWTMDVDEITPAIITGLPALSPGWEYRSFRSPGTVTADPADFLRVRIEVAP